MIKFLKNIKWNMHVAILLAFGTFVITLVEIIYWQPQREAENFKKEKEACYTFCENNNTSMKTYNNKTCFCVDSTESLPCYRLNLRNPHKVYYYMINKENINKMDDLR